MTLKILPEPGVTETKTWVTDIMTSHNGTERRFNLMELPRTTFSVNFAAVDQTERREIMQELQDELSSPGIQPMWPYAQPLTQETLAASSRLYFSPGLVQLQAGAYLVLLNPDTRQTITGTVASVETDGCLLDAPVGSDIGPGWFAVKGGIFLLGNGGGFTWDHITGDLKMSMVDYEDITLVRDNSTAVLETLDGLPVLNKQFLAGANEKIEYERETLDDTINKPEVFTSWLHATITGTRQFRLARIGCDDNSPEEELDYWALFWDTVRGAWKPFLLSTQLEDLTLVSTLGQNASSLTVNENQAGDLWQYGTFSHIEILYGDGTKSWHTITSSAGGLMNISPNTPDDPKVSNVQRISYLLKVRMGDKAQIRHAQTESRISFDVTTTDDG